MQRLGVQLRVALTPPRCLVEHHERFEQANFRDPFKWSAVKPTPTL